MRVAVIGATGRIGRPVVRSLVGAGHDVVGLARDAERSRVVLGLGAEAYRTSLADHDGLVAMLAGADAVCNMAARVPAGLSALLPRAWRINDRLHTEGVRRVVAAAREAGVRRIVQQSASFLYADQGDAWITEDAPVDITPATEPASVGELQVQDYSCGSRVGVVLRFASVIGDDPETRSGLRSARSAVAGGAASSGWAHVIHTDDLGPAVLASLTVPTGVYNVGAEPIRRAELVAGLSLAAGRESADLAGPLLRWLGGVRMEPLGRSLRVSSDRFTAHSGWTPRRARFDASWLVEGSESGVLW